MGRVFESSAVPLAIFLVAGATSVILAVRVLVRMFPVLRRTAIARMTLRGGRSVVVSGESNDEGRVLLLAFGESAKSKELAEFLRSVGPKRAVVVTDDPQLPHRLQGRAAVELVPLPGGETSPLYSTVLRSLEIAATHGATRFATVGSSFGKDNGRELPKVVEVTQLDFIVRIAQSIAKTESETFEAKIKSSVKTELADLWKQTECLHSLYRTLDGLEVLPNFGGYAIAPDLMCELDHFVRQNGPRSILELGSGSSTVMFALALKAVGAGRVVAIDHDPIYAARTATMLESRGLSNWATVVYAPIAPVELEGSQYNWYDLRGIDLPHDVDLLFVDGPPEALGKRVRYPAFKLLVKNLSERAVIVLDDGRRADEKAIASAWSEHPFVVAIEQLPLERGPFKLTIRKGAESSDLQVP